MNRCARGISSGDARLLGESDAEQEIGKKQGNRCTQLPVLLKLSVLVHRSTASLSRPHFFGFGWKGG